MRLKLICSVFLALLVAVPSVSFAEKWKQVGHINDSNVEISLNDANDCDWRLSADLRRDPTGFNKVGEVNIELTSRLARQYYSSPKRPVAAEFRAQVHPRVIRGLIAYYVFGQEGQMRDYLDDVNDGLIEDLILEVDLLPDDQMFLMMHSDKRSYFNILLPDTRVRLEKRCINSKARKSAKRNRR